MHLIVIPVTHRCYEKFPRGRLEQDGSLTLVVGGCSLTVSCSSADACGYGLFPYGQLFGRWRLWLGAVPLRSAVRSLTLVVGGCSLTVRCSVMQLFDVVLCQIEV